MLEYFDVYLSGIVAKPSTIIDNDVKEAPKELPIKIDVKKITLAQYDRVSKDVITAHNIADYRQRKFNLTLLPKVEVLLDILLEGVVLKK